MSDSTLADFLRRLTSALDGAGVPYMVVGSLASSIHGQPRSTADVDIVVQMQPDHIAKLEAAFDPDLYYFDAEMAADAVRRRSMFNIIDMVSSWKVDMISPKATRHARTEFPRRVQVVFDGVPIWCASAEDTLIGKLRWAQETGSNRQIEDASGIVKFQADLLDRTYIETWVEELGLRREWNEVLRQS